MHTHIFHIISNDDLVVQPIERAETIPAHWNYGEEIFRFERDHLFSHLYNFAGHTSQLQHRGDQIVAEVAGSPVILVKGDDGMIRGFYNICRHRSGPLATENCNSRVLQCKYHGWTYLLDGSLRGTPRFNRTELFDKKDFGLFPISISEWEGMLFAAPSPPPVPLKEMVKNISDRIYPEKLSTKKFARRIIYHVKCNWKVYVDNYLEGYHVPFVHPELATLLDLQEYVTETSEWHSLQYSPLKDNDSVYGTGQAFYYFIFPNFMLNILPGRLQTNLVLPTSHNTCRVIFDYFYDDVDSDESKKKLEEDLLYSDSVQKEDIEICEYVQRGLESRVYTKGRISPETELGVYHFQSLLKNFYRTSLQRASR
ncbi:MAG: Rieske 2Fe-2S domain-containing protein [Ignavibacteriales bacterium]|nr:Rieske 2Fe-2S domain-containing protein [Ignavibacteriales bacterium]